MSAAALEAPRRAGGLLGRVGRLLARSAGWALGALLCLTPLTAVLAQGWLMARMRRLALAAAARRRGGEPAWGSATPAESLPLRVARIAREGATASLTLFLGLLPFTALVLFSWWGGWENSFNKGYEQSWVGPALGLLGVALGLPLLARAPLALVHQAVEGRAAAFFERRRVGRIMRCAGWEHLALALAFVLAAAPLLAAKGLPVFIEKIRPDLDLSDPEAVRRFAGGWRLLAALYLFAALWLLRGWAARLYAKARLRMEMGAPTDGIVGAVGAWTRRLLTWTIWLGLVVQIYLGQFLNNDWAEWLNPPLTATPFAPSLGG